MVNFPLFRHSRRSLWGAAFAFLAAFGTSLFGQSGTPSASDGFDPNVSGTVSAVTLQPDGKILVGGAFTAFQPNGAAQPVQDCNNLARLNADGTVDGSFRPEPNGQVLAICLQPDGKILIGGYFTAVQPVPATTPTTCNHIARLNADGSLDTTFAASTQGTYAAEVNAIALQADGRILIGGAFSTVSGSAMAHLARLNANGTVDATFNPSPNAQVDAICVQPNGKILVGGGFATLKPNGAASATTVGSLARLNADGSIDAAFAPPFPNNVVLSIIVQPNGQILAGGTFVTAQPASYSGAVNVDCILRLNADGTIDPNFLTNLGGPVQQVLLQPDGKIVVVGEIGSISNGTSNIFTANYAARLNIDGTPDTTFVPSPNYTVNGAAIQPDGSIILGGAFTQVQPNGAISPTTRHGLARVNHDGTLDVDFNPDAFGGISVMVKQANGQYVIGGEFSSVDGVTRTNLARINADGSLDPAFTPSTNGAVYAVAVQSSGQIVIGGNFTSVDGVGIPYLARLNADGSLDQTFDPFPAGVIYTLLIQPNGKILVGGNYIGFEPANGKPGSATTTSVNYLGRLNADGSVDTAFQPQPNGPVYTLVYNASSNSILVGGNFSAMSPIDFNAHTEVTYAYPNCVLIDAGTGLLYGTFLPNPNGQVYSIAVQPDGKILICGAFTALQPNPTSSTQVVNGILETYTTPWTARSYIARINPADGSLDTSFAPTADAPALAIAVDPLTSKIVVGGSFANINGTPRGHIARLNTDGSLDTGFSASLNGPVDTVQYVANSQFVATGTFTTVLPAGASTVSTAPHVIEFNGDGSVNTSFQLSYQASPVFSSLAVQGDGKLVVGGSFTSVAGVYATCVARFNTDNSQDTSFYANANAQVNSVVLEADGSFLVGGAFSAIGHGLASNFAHLHVDSTLDTTFSNVPDGPVNAIAAQVNTPIVIGGSFAHVGGVALANLARLKTNGAVDSSFAPNPNGAVNVVVQQADGKYLVGGSFTSIAGQSVPRLARLSSSGSLDTGFEPSVNGAVGVIQLQPDGRILIGGGFTTVNGAARSSIARLNADGSLDTTFNPGATGGTVSTIILQAPATASGAGGASTDRIVVGGSFTTIAGTSISYLARLNSDGSLDPTFNPAPNGPVTALAIEADGKLVAAGSFTTIAGLPRNGIARIADPAGVGQTLAVSADFSSVTWTLTGGVELSTALVEYSTDDMTWSTLGYATRVGSSNIWRLAGLTSLPSGTVFYIQAVGTSQSGQGSSTSNYSVSAQFAGIPVPGIQSAGTAGAVTGSPFYYEIAATNTPVSYAATGLPAGLTINAGTGVISGTPTTAGTTSVTISATSAGGTTTGTLVITVAASGSAGSPVAPLARLTNLSTRSSVSTAAPLVAGFSIGGTASKTVLLRGIGPGLASTFSLSGALSKPYLSLYDAAGQVVISNKAWDGSAPIMQIFAEFGAFPLIVGSADTAAVTSLAPGGYTVQISDGAGTGGTALAEIYDADANSTSFPQRLTNLSGRGTVSPGSPLIGGLSIGGTGTKLVLLRAVGPGLATTFGLTGTLAAPVLSVYDSGNHLLAQNTGWGTPVTVNAGYPAASASTIAGAAAAAGAFALASGSADSAVLVALPAGSYTAQVTGGSGQSGAVLFEIYEAPQ